MHNDASTVRRRFEMNPKRKRENKTENVEKKKNSGEEEEVEIEEFYAILKRIHVAAKYFEKDDALRRRNLTAGKGAWKPSFELEDFRFQGDDGVKKDGGVEFDSCAVTNHKGSGLILDLDSEPKPVCGEHEK